MATGSWYLGWLFGRFVSRTPRWLWYLGWLIGWFVVLWSFVFVPVSELFRDGGATFGEFRWLVLFSGVVLFIYGFHFINRKFRTRERDLSSASGNASAVVSGGMTDRDAALPGTTREIALSPRTAAHSDAVVTSPRPVAESAVVTPTPAITGATKNISHGAPTGVMKSAGNPLVRRAFAQAMKEVESKTYDPGLWAMALVECNGDEHAARLAYMKARAADFIGAHLKTAEAAEPTKLAT